MCLFHKKRRASTDGYSYVAMQNAIRDMIGGTVSIESISSALTEVSPEEVEELIKHVQTYKYQCADEEMVLKCLRNYPERVYRISIDQLIKDSEGTLAESISIPELKHGGSSFFVLYHNDFDEFKVNHIAREDFLLYCYEFNSLAAIRNIRHFRGK